MLRFTRWLFDLLRSRIQFKIILPFAILTLMVALIGTFLSTNLVTGSLQERFTRQLVDTGGAVADSLAQREQFHLSELRSMAFTEGIDEAIIAGDRDKLRASLFPIVVNDNVDRIDVVNINGRQLMTIRRPPGTTALGDYTITDGADMRGWPTVGNVLSGIVDNQGDKHVALATVDDGDQLFITAGPVKQGDKVVGAILVSTHLQNLLRSLKQGTFADVTLYNPEGQVIRTTLPVGADTHSILALSHREIQRLLSQPQASSLRLPINLRDREYDVLHDIFWARGEPLGFFSVALQTQFIEASSATVRNQMAVIFLTALILVFGIGYFMSNIITNQVQHLMENASAVASGDFTRRTRIYSHDEIGLLARSLDDMTDSLARYTNDLQHKIDELTALYESSTAVTIKSGLNLDQVLRTVTVSVRELMQNVDQVVIHLLDEEEQILTPIVAAPNDATGFPTLLISKQGKMHDILAAAKPQVIQLSDIANYSPQGSFRMNGHSDAIIVPLVAGSETVGMLTMTLMSNGAAPQTKLNEDGARLLGTFANQAAMAIKNAQLFEATEKAYQELQQLDDLKTEFINIAAHELRTPLGAIMGHASFSEKRAPEKLRKYMRFIVISALRMRTMVDAMLTIQRLDAGTAFLKLMSIDIRDIISKVASDYRPMAELEHHTLQVNMPDDLPLIAADPEKIGLVISNLLSNAIKFTPEQGQIEVFVQDHGDSILVGISDTGVGIAPEDQKRIFERFYQARPEHIAGHGGIGIGLTIVKHLLELHSGEVWVESDVGQGSTFFVKLPKNLPTKQQATTPVVLSRVPTH